MLLTEIVLLAAEMPAEYRRRGGPRPRGVAGRNAGLGWVLHRARTGVVYFADDDNTYDVRLFAEVRITRQL